MNLKGRWIDENEFYFALRDYNYLLPTTWRASTMFAISPGETELLLNIMMRKSEGTLAVTDDPTIELPTEPTPYEPIYGPNLTGARTQDGLVAAALADPSRLPAKTRPDGDAIGYNVPISPYRTSEIPAADIGYFSDCPMKDGTLPNTLLYLDAKPAGEEMRRRIDRQYQWLKSLLGTDVHEIEIYAIAPEFTAGFHEPECKQTSAVPEEVQIKISGSGL